MQTVPRVSSSTAGEVWLTVAVLGVAVWAALQSRVPPAAVPASAPASEFSAERAITHLRVIAQRPHPTGTADNARVREYLLEQLRSLNLDPQVQTATGTDLQTILGHPYWVGMARNAALVLAVPVIILLTGPISFIGSISSLLLAVGIIGIELLLSLLAPQLDVLTDRARWAIPLLAGLAGFIVHEILHLFSIASPMFSCTAKKSGILHFLSMDERVNWSARSWGSQWRRGRAMGLVGRFANRPYDRTDTTFLRAGPIYVPLREIALDLAASADLGLASASPSLPAAPGREVGFGVYSTGRRVQRGQAQTRERGISPVW